MPDDALAHLSSKGQVQALEALLEWHTPTAIRACYAAIAHREEALDAAQTTLIQVAKWIARNGLDVPLWDGCGSVRMA